MPAIESNPLKPALARLEERIEETYDVVSLRFSPADGAPLPYRPGQFNMLGVPGFGEAPFSFSSLEDDSGTFVHTIRAAGNVVSALQPLQVGHQVAFRGPFGAGWPLDRAQGRHLILVAGGIGMAPLRPVVAYALNHRDRCREVFLLYGAKTSDDILFRRELRAWSEGITVRLAVEEVRSELPLEVHKGLVTSLFRFMDIPLPEATAFLCGPQIMMKFAAAGLILDGVPNNEIYVSLERRMKCGIAHCGHCQIGAKYVCKDGPVFSLADITRFQDTLL